MIFFGFFYLAVKCSFRTSNTEIRLFNHLTTKKVIWRCDSYSRVAIKLYLIPLPPYRRRSYSTPSLPMNSIRIGYPALGLFIDFKRLRKRANYSTLMPWKQSWENFANFVLNADCCGAMIGCLFPWFTPRQGLLYIWTKHWKKTKTKNGR